LAAVPHEIESNNVTVTGGYVGAVIRALEARGVATTAILDAAGLEVTPTNDPLNRVPLDAVHRLLTAAVELTGDPYVGLYAANFLHASNLHALGYALTASNTLREFLERLVRYFRLLSGSSRPRLRESNGTVVLEFVQVTPTPHLTDDIFGLFLVNLIRELSDGSIRPSLVRLYRPAPPDDGTRHRREFGCEIQFDADYSSFTFDVGRVDLPLSGGSRDLAEQNERIVISHLAKLDRSDIQTRVRALLLQQLPSGNVTKEDVAKRLFMSPRTLQIKLAKSRTTFQDVVNDTRRALACGYIENSAMSITEIAYLLGFSDTSNFSRAFRRWTGRSPRAYAEQLRRSIHRVGSVAHAPPA
jgi:AraC-like DNA-binding protein